MTDGIASIPATEAQVDARPTSQFEIVQVGHDTPAYQDVVALRYRVLREPLGLHFTPEQLRAEADDTFLAAYETGYETTADEKRLVGCLVLARRSPAVVQMRQVAVATGDQGRGVGRALVLCAERLARQQGYALLLLHARETAIPFYLKLGYAPHGDTFKEVGLPHLEMRKDLSTD